jgi:hypothetical protein
MKAGPGANVIHFSAFRRKKSVVAGIESKMITFSFFSTSDLDPILRLLNLQLELYILGLTVF